MENMTLAQNIYDGTVRPLEVRKTFEEWDGQSIPSPKLYTKHEYEIEKRDRKIRILQEQLIIALDVTNAQKANLTPAGHQS